MYETHAIPLLEQPCSRSESYGEKKLFVFARDGKRLLLLDDVEEEFGIGVPDADGVLRQWNLYGPLSVALRNFAREGS